MYGDATKEEDQGGCPLLDGTGGAFAVYITDRSWRGDLPSHSR